jgi:hypothetical protein
MGRASNRKKRRRQAGLGSEDSGHAPAGQRWAMEQVLAALRTFTERARTEREQVAAATRVWCGGGDPVPADVSSWPEGSLGDRFWSGQILEEARHAPCLATAVVPDADVIGADPAHWTVAIRALIRAVLLDGVPLDDQAVTMIIDALGPAAEAELAYQTAAAEAVAGTVSWDDLPEFPEGSGPVFLLGACALVDATHAVLGENPLQGIIDLLATSLDGAFAGLDGRVAAEALFVALAQHYRCELPGDAELLDSIGAPGSGDPLEGLIAAGEVAPGNALRAGLSVLLALGELCQSNAESVLSAAASDRELAVS